jgi:glycine cleavage system H protein
MSNPSSLKYADTHEWIRLEDEGGELTVGITEHAQDLLGDLVFAELPEVGQRFAAKEECMLLESVKAASDIYMPVSGEITAINMALVDEPELINQQPFCDGWLFKIQPDNATDIDGLLSAESYEQFLDE